MAKKKSKSSKTEEKDLPKKEEEEEEVEGEEEEEEEEGEETEMVYLQVDTGDIIKLKQILDETVANTFLEDSVLDELNGSSGTRKSLGFKEDNNLNNLKLFIMTLACAFAMVAQFAPLPFPESRFVLGGCCAAYFALSGVLTLIGVFWDKDCILLTKVLENIPSAVAAKNPNLKKYGLRVRTNMLRFSEFYTVIIEFEGLEDSPSVSKTWSVGKFFDVEGMFDEYGLELEVEELYKRFEAGQFDKAQQQGKKLKTN